MSKAKRERDMKPPRESSISRAAFSLANNILISLVESGVLTKGAASEIFAKAIAEQQLANKAEQDEVAHLLNELKISDAHALPDRI
jgi:hypothetical protein